MASKALSNRALPLDQLLFCNTGQPKDKPVRRGTAAQQVALLATNRHEQTPTAHYT